MNLEIHAVKIDYPTAPDTISVSCCRFSDSKIQFFTHRYTRKYGPRRCTTSRLPEINFFWLFLHRRMDTFAKPDCPCNQDM